MARWPLKTTYFWQEAPLLRPLLLVVAGIVAYDRSWPARLSSNMAFALFLASGVLVVLLAFVRRHHRWLDVVYITGLSVWFALVGWCSYAATDVRNRSDWAGSGMDTSGLSLVHIEAPPQTTPATIKLHVRWLAALQGGIPKRASGEALLYVYRRSGMPSFAEGDTLLAPSRWLPVQNGGNPYAFDNAAFQRRRNIFHQQFVSPDEVSVFGKFNPAEAGPLTSIHIWADRQLRAYIRDSATLGLLQAMLLGDESGFDPELRQAYSQTGIIHIVSISGSHVAVLFLVVTGVFFWLKGKRGAWVKYAVGLALVWLYVLVAGAPPSALRSALMFTVIALSGLSGREGHTLNTVICAAFALLVAQPAWLFSVGFQLSFGAVLSMMLFYTPLYRLWYWPKKMWLANWLWRAVAASVAAEVLTAPLVIFYFHNFPLLFMPANIVAAVMAGICALVGGLSVIALCWIPPVARLLGLLVTLVVNWFNRVVIWMQGWNVAALQHLWLTMVELLLFYLLLTGLAVWWLKRSRKGLFIALPAACAMSFLLTLDAYKTQRQQRLVVYSNSREPAIEIIRGRYFETLAGKADGYNLAGAHTGYGAWRQITAKPASPYFSFKGKRMLILTDSAVQSYEKPLPVDVLILARSLRQIRVANFLQTFSPKEIVLAMRPSPYHLQRWADSCAAHKIRLYNVAADGAYIVE